MDIFLPQLKLLAPEFEYPPSYLKYIVSNCENELVPWRFICDKPAVVDFHINILKNEYPDKLLIPFARLEDSANGDLACFDGGQFIRRP